MSRRDRWSRKDMSMQATANTPDDQTPRTRAARSALSALTLGVLTAACGDQADERQSPRFGADDPVYVAFSTIDTADGRTGYAATTSSIEGDVLVDISAGIESPGGGQLYAPPGEGYFLLGS